MFSVGYLQPNAADISKVLSEVSQQTARGGPLRVVTAWGHVFVEGGGGRSLTVIDSAPSSQQSVLCGGGSSVLHLDLSDNPLRTLSFPETDRPSFICVHSDGLVRLYRLDPTTRQWFPLQEARLVSEGRIHSATIHPAHSALYWCQAVTSREGTTDSVPRDSMAQEANSTDMTCGDVTIDSVISGGVISDDLNSDNLTSENVISINEVVLTRTVPEKQTSHPFHSVDSQESRMLEGSATPQYAVFTASMVQDEAGFTLGTSHQLLTDCPPCSMHHAGDQLLLHFSEPAPSGVYVTWRQSSRTVCLCVHPQGVVVSSRVYSNPASFHQMALRSSTSWAQSAPISSWTVVENVGTEGEAWFVDREGQVWAVGGDGCTTRVCCISPWPPGREAPLLCARHPLGILTASANTIRVHGLCGGAALQTLDLDLAPCGTWRSAAGDNGGLTTSRGLLQVVRGSRLEVREARPDRNSPTKQLLACMTTLSKKVQESVVTQAFRLQTPALLLAARQQSYEEGDLSSVGLLRQGSHTENGKLEGDGRRESGIPTKLQTSLETLCRKFEDLEDLQWAKFDQDLKRGPMTVDREVCRLLPPGDDLDQDYIYFKVVLLVSQYPPEMTHAVLARTGLQPSASVPYSEGAWSYLKSPAGTSVLIALTRLLFVTRPSQLPVFLGRLVGGAHDDTPAFLGQARAPLYRRLIPHLPDPRHSTDPKGATIALSQIMFRSGCDGCEEKSLQLLIQSGLWREAVGLLEQLSPGDAALPRVYWTILTAASQAGALPTVRDAMLDLAPADLSVVSLLHHLLPSVPPGEPTTGCDLPVGPIVDYLCRNHHLLAK